MRVILQDLIDEKWFSKAPKNPTISIMAPHEAKIIHHANLTTNRAIVTLYGRVAGTDGVMDLGTCEVLTWSDYTGSLQQRIEDVHSRSLSSHYGIDRVQGDGVVEMVCRDLSNDECEVYIRVDNRSLDAPLLKIPLLVAYDQFLLCALTDGAILTLKDKASAKFVQKYLLQEVVKVQNMVNKRAKVLFENGQLTVSKEELNEAMKQWFLLSAESSIVEAQAELQSVTNALTRSERLSHKANRATHKYYRENSQMFFKAKMVKQFWMGDLMNDMNTEGAWLEHASLDVVENFERLVKLMVTIALEDTSAQGGEPASNLFYSDYMRESLTVSGLAERPALLVQLRGEEKEDGVQMHEDNVPFPAFWIVVKATEHEIPLPEFYLVKPKAIVFEPYSASCAYRVTDGSVSTSEKPKFMYSADSLGLSCYEPSIDSIGTQQRDGAEFLRYPSKIHPVLMPFTLTSVHYVRLLADLASETLSGNQEIDYAARLELATFKHAQVAVNRFSPSEIGVPDNISFKGGFNLPLTLAYIITALRDSWYAQQAVYRKLESLGVGSFSKEVMV